MPTNLPQFHINSLMYVHLYRSPAAFYERLISALGLLKQNLNCIRKMNMWKIRLLSFLPWQTFQNIITSQEIEKTKILICMCWSNIHIMHVIQFDLSHFGINSNYIYETPSVTKIIVFNIDQITSEKKVSW